MDDTNAGNILAPKTLRETFSAMLYPTFLNALKTMRDDVIQIEGSAAIVGEFEAGHAQTSRRFRSLVLDWFAALRAVHSEHAGFEIS